MLCFRARRARSVSFLADGSPWWRPCTRTGEPHVLLKRMIRYLVSFVNRNGKGRLRSADGYVSAANAEHCNCSLPFIPFSPPASSAIRARRPVSGQLCFASGALPNRAKVAQ